MLVFDLTSRQDATEKCHHLKPVVGPLRLVLNFTYPLEHVTERIVLRERMSLVANDISGLVVVKIQNGYCFSTVSNQSYPATQVSVPWFFSF